jgi:hypothetical protein
MKMLVEEHPHLVFIGIAHLLGGDGDLIAVPVASRGSKLVYAIQVTDLEVVDTNTLQVLGINGATGVMR